MAVAGGEGVVGPRLGRRGQAGVLVGVAVGTVGVIVGVSVVIGVTVGVIVGVPVVVGVTVGVAVGPPPETVATQKSGADQYVPSFTRSWKRYSPSLAGVKYAWAVFAPVRVTAGPVIWVHS